MADSRARAHPREVRALLRKGRLSEPFLAAKYRFSPYGACEHGCLYCDGRAERYWVEGEFDRDIVVRTNGPEVLDAELARLREKGIVSIGSGITDAYQPLEQSYCLTRRCAEALARHRCPAAVLTKSALAARDLDLWGEINERAGFVLLVSLVFARDGPRRIFEPRAGSVQERLELLASFKRRGCSVGVLAMPLLPLICDTDENMAELLTALRRIPVDFVIPGGLTLRPGRQKEVFFDALRRCRPDLTAAYEELYAENRASGAPRADYGRALQRRSAALLAGAGVPSLVPHAVYRNRLELYDELHVLLLHMIEIYAGRGVDTGPLREAQRRYVAWLLRRKAEYDRRRSLSHEDLAGELRALCAGPGMEELLGNGRLAAFARDVVLERRVFDYAGARLR